MMHSNWKRRADPVPVYGFVNGAPTLVAGAVFLCTGIAGHGSQFEIPTARCR
jgi:hypothetical protein